MARNATACSIRESSPTSWSKSKRDRAPEHSAEPSRRTATDTGGKAQRHVRERDLRRVDREHPDHLREPLRFLRAHKRRLDLRRERRGPEPEEAVALAARAAPRQPTGPRPSSVRYSARPARELLGRGLRLELGELGRLLGEESTRLQLEQCRDQDARNSPHASRSSSSRSTSRSRKASTIRATSSSRQIQARPSGRGSAGGRTGLRMRRDRARAPRTITGLYRYPRYRSAPTAARPSIGPLGPPGRGFRLRRGGFRRAQELPTRR